MDKPSSSSSSSSLATDVFLNFRGEDTRNSFVCHLHKALEWRTLKVYIDKKDLQKGDDLENLLEAIAGSKLSIVVFSENYATSTWCLKELVQILKCKKDQNQIVMPIFYKVDPSHIRKQTGSFGKAFAQHESKCKKDDQLQEVQTWRSALKEATDIAGCDSKNYEDDAALIDYIANQVFHKVNLISPLTKDGLVAMDSHLNKMRRLLYTASDDDVVYVGIWGMGGLGKTTIADAVYCKISHEFHHSCFLKDVREGFSTKNEVQMQLEFMSGIHKGIINDWDGSYTMMLKRLRNKRILVVLDDVSHFLQIEKLLGIPNEHAFGRGSKVIVTTRDEHVIRGFRMYKPKPLSDPEALELFNQNAFRKKTPSKEFDHLSECAIKYAHGLPLALKILGAYLYNKKTSEWKDVLEKLKKLRDISDVLKISFDGLDDFQKNIFLDITCFFKGMHREYVEIILDSCGFHASSGLSNLIEKALVSMSKFGGLEIHDFLQEIGREIVCKKPWKHSRLWSYEDVQDTLTKIKAMKVEGVMIELSESEEIHVNAEAFDSMTNLRLLRITYPQYKNYFDKPFRKDFEGESWPERLYQRNSSCKLHLNGDLMFLSHKLRVLTWHGCPLKSLPSKFNPQYLVDLDMRDSHIEQLWQEPKAVKNLLSINLSCCQNLKEIPLCTEAPKLHKLILDDCTSLVQVSPSISAFNGLAFLSLARCTELRSLPRSIHLKSLKTLVLSYCSNLEMFPEISEDMEALSELMLDDTAIKELPSSIERLRGLRLLKLENCTSLVRLPDSICNLADLAYLYLRKCSKLCDLPENMGNLKSLCELQVEKTGIKRLPASITHLGLGCVSLYGCKQMEAPLSSWPSIPSSFEGRCTVVAHLDFTRCNLLELSDAIDHFSSLKSLNLSRNENLESLPATMKRLYFLEQLELEGCKRLKSIPELSSRISYINAHGCTALETVSTPKSPYHIGRCFTFSNCSRLVQEYLFRDIVETHLPPQGNCARPFYLSFPGSELPRQFIHQCTGSSVTAKLPENWFDKQFLGFAICAVTNKPQRVHYYKLTARCLCTFKGNGQEYRFSFFLFDCHFGGYSRNWLESSHVLVGYVPWSEFDIHVEEVNERHYTEAKFEIEVLHYEVSDMLPTKGRFDPSIERCRCIERCGVCFFFKNNEDEEVAGQDFKEGSGSDITSHTTSDEEEQHLILLEVFEGANRATRSYIRNEDNNSSRNRRTLESWSQKVGVTSGLTQGHLDDGFEWFSHGPQLIPDQGTTYLTCRYVCQHRRHGCWAEAIARHFIDDQTILEITYVGRHTCWKTQPMLTYKVRVTPGMGIEGFEAPPDGFTWGVYGQTDVQGAEYPRVYYVCTPQHVGGCMAIKEVQRSNDQQILKITYRGRHTCMHTCREASDCIAEWYDSIISSGSDASSIQDHDQVVQSPSSPGANLDAGSADVNEEDKDMTSCLCQVWWCWRLWTSVTSRNETDQEMMDSDQPVESNSIPSHNP